MPNLRGKSVLLKELNTLNGRNYTLSDVDIRRVSTVGHSEITALSSGTLPASGRATFTHRAVGLDELGAVWPGSITILRTPTLLEALTRISQQLGIAFDSVDLVDVTIPSVGGLVTLTAAPTSLVYKGSTQITVETSTVQTQQIYPLTDLTRTKPWSPTELVTAFGVRNNRADIQPNGYTVGVPVPITGAYNTEVPLTARMEYGYVGNTSVRYNRTDLTTLGTQVAIWNQAWTGTTYQFLQKFLPELAAVLTANDIVNTAVTFNGTTGIPVPVQSAPNALNALGDLTVNLMVGNPYAYVKVRNLSAQVLYNVMGTAGIRNLCAQVLYKVN